MIDFLDFMETSEIDLEMAKDLYGLFLQDLEQQMLLLQKNMDENHLPGVIEATHAIKGIAVKGQGDVSLVLFFMWNEGQY